MAAELGRAGCDPAVRAAGVGPLQWSGGPDHRSALPVIGQRLPVHGDAPCCPLGRGMGAGRRGISAVYEIAKDNLCMVHVGHPMMSWRFGFGAAVVVVIAVVAGQ